jgi:hypothetical protein
MCVYIYVFLLQHTHRTEYYSVITKNEILSFAVNWLLSEISQTQKDGYHCSLPYADA